MIWMLLGVASSGYAQKTKKVHGSVRGIGIVAHIFGRHSQRLLAILGEGKTIVDILMKKLRMAVKQTGIKHVAVAGGVSANNGLRNAFRDHAKRFGWTIYIPKFSYTTDNAAMIGCVGTFKYRDGEFATIDLPAYSKVTFK